MLELVAAGRRPAELAREFGCTAQTIANWMAEASSFKATGAKPGSGALSAAEREELIRLRRGLRRVREERDILAKATAWFAARGERTPTPSSNS